MIFSNFLQTSDSLFSTFHIPLEFDYDDHQLDSTVYFIFIFLLDTLQFICSTFIHIKYSTCYTYIHNCCCVVKCKMWKKAENACTDRQRAEEERRWAVLNRLELSLHSFFLEHLSFEEPRPPPRWEDKFLFNFNKRRAEKDSGNIY